MWTAKDAALQDADSRLLELLEIDSLRSSGSLYTRVLVAERWSEGLAKNIFEVQYKGWRPWCLVRLVWDSLYQAEAEWQSFEWERPPDDWQKDPAMRAVEAPEERERLRRIIEAKLGQEVEITGFVEYPSSTQDGMQVFEGEVWAAIPKEEILIRLNADTGDLMGWRHEGWFRVEEGEEGLEKGVDELQETVESMPIFPPGLQFEDAWPSTDRSGHLEMIWTRLFQGELVENDALYACVNRYSGRVPECLINWSELDQALDIQADQAVGVLDKAFDQHFPGAVRCGALRRMYVEIPGQTVKPRAWVANAIDDSGPVQICVGKGGAVLRVDSIA